MPDAAQQWRSYVQEIVARVAPGFARGGAPLPEPVTVHAGGERLLAHAGARLVLGLPADDGGDEAVARWGELLGALDPDELRRGLELLLLRLTLHELALVAREQHRAATADAWVEAGVANELARAGTAAFLEQHRAFLEPFLQRAMDALSEHIGGSGAPDAEPAPPEHLWRHVAWFLRDLERTDPPDIARSLSELIAGGVEARRRAENELVLRRMLEEGSPALRRAAADLLAAGAGAGTAAVVLASGVRLPPEARLRLALRLREEGREEEATGELSTLAAGLRTPPATAAAAALGLAAPASLGLDPAALLAELEEDGLAQCLRLLPRLHSAPAAGAVAPLLRHPDAAVRREAFRLLAPVLAEADAWPGAHDPDSAVRALSVGALPDRPGAEALLARLLLDAAPDVRAAAAARTAADPGLAARVRTLLAAGGDDEQRALAAMLAPTEPAQAQEILGRVLRRRLRPHAAADAAARALGPGGRDRTLLQGLAADLLARERREAVALAARTLGRPDWTELVERLESAPPEHAAEAALALRGALPEGWYEAGWEAPTEPQPATVLRQLAAAHPEPLLRAAALLWLANDGGEDRAATVRLCEQDPSALIAGLAPALRGDREDGMGPTVVEKALFLRTVPLLRSVPTPNLLAIAGEMRPAEHAPGDAIVRQGERGDRLYVLFEGEARAERAGAGGETSVLGTLAPGAVFGEMSLFDSEPRSATVTAVQPCRTLTLERETFHRLGLQYPEVLWEVCRVLSQRSRGPAAAPAR